MLHDSAENNQIGWKRQECAGHGQQSCTVDNLLQEQKKVSGQHHILISGYVGPWRSERIQALQQQISKILEMLEIVETQKSLDSIGILAQTMCVLHSVSAGM